MATKVHCDRCDVWLGEGEGHWPQQTHELSRTFLEDKGQTADCGPLRLEVKLTFESCDGPERVELCDDCLEDAIDAFAHLPIDPPRAATTGCRSGGALMPRPSQWLASVMSGISSKPETPGSMAEFHPVTKHEDLSRVGPSIPCVEAAGSTAEPLRGAVTAGICPHCVRGIAVRRMDSPFHCQFCGGTGVKAVGCEPLGLRCQHEYESRSPDGDGLSETRSESVALQSVDPLSAPAGEKAEHKAVAGFAVTVPHEPRAGSEPADSLSINETTGVPMQPEDKRGTTANDLPVVPTREGSV